jgi:hypothetical protein
LGQAKDFKTGISCFSLKHAVLRSKGADWLARSQYDASEWSDCCFSELALNTIIVVNSNPVHDEVYSIQQYVIKFVSDLRQVGGFLWLITFQCN